MGGKPQQQQNTRSSTTTTQTTTLSIANQNTSDERGKGWLIRY